jgi:AcrR family transcriptional regulator
VNARKTGYAKGEISRQTVLDTALAVLAEKGLANTSIQDIADAAGVSKGVVHYHFASKDELLERVLDRACEGIERRVVAVFHEDGMPMDRIRRGLAEMWAVRRDGVPEMRVLTELHMHARQNPAMRKAFGHALQKARRVMIDVGLGALMAMGLKPKVPVNVIPRMIMATLDGLALQHEVDPITKEEEGEILKAIEATAIALFEL